MATNYAVVKFPNEHSVEVVPLSWYISTSDECFWPPPGTKKMKILSLIENCEDPQSDWEIHPARILGKYADLITAQRKARKAEDTSDLSSQNENIQTGRGLRKKIVNDKYQNTDSETKESSDENEYPAFRRNIFGSVSTTPNLKPRSSIRGQPEDKFSKIQSHKDDGSDEVSAPRLSFKSAQPRGASPMPGIRKNPEASKKSVQSFTEINYINTTDGQIPKHSATENASNYDFQMRVFEELSLLNIKLDNIADRLGNVSNAVRALNTNKVITNVDGKLEEYRQKIPIKNDEDMIKIEEWLLEKDNSKLMTLELNRIGGPGMPQTVRKILYRVLTNEVAQQYSWDGAKQKKAFKKLKIAYVILEAVKMQYEVTENEIISVIKVWLVKAKERMKYKAREGEEIVG